MTFPALLTGAMKEGNGNAQVTQLDTARICIAGQVYGDVQTSLDARVGVGCSDAHTRITPSLRVDYRLRLVSSLIGGSARQARGGLNPVRAERPPGNPK